MCCGFTLNAFLDYYTDVRSRKWYVTNIILLRWWEAIPGEYQKTGGDGFKCQPFAGNTGKMMMRDIKRLFGLGK
jgi:hypothetical protein